MTMFSWLRGKRDWFKDYDVWIIQGFLTGKEKRALINFYRDEIGTLLERKTGGALTSEEDHIYRSSAARMKFIMDHF